MRGGDGFGFPVEPGMTRGEMTQREDYFGFATLYPIRDDMNSARPGPSLLLLSGFAAW